MGCHLSKEEDVVIHRRKSQEFQVGATKPRRKSLSQKLLAGRNSEPTNGRRDVFSIFGEHGMVLERQSAHECSPHSMSESVFSTATTASDNERANIRGPLDQYMPALNISYGAFSDKGMRKTNEDRQICTSQTIQGDTVAYFGVYDGHGGSRVSEYLSSNLHLSVYERMRRTNDMERSVVEAFAATDDVIFKKQMESGSTAVSVVVRGKQAVIASIGDSQAVLSCDGKAKNICVPHTPDLSSEHERILAAKGTVVKGRIFGLLGVSRAFGDNDFKTSRGEFKDKFNGDLVSSKPDVVHHTISSQDEFIVLGSDGLFDVMEPQQVVNFVRTKIELHGEVQHASEELVSHAISLGSMDNVSAVIICFNQPTTANSESE
ncbi:TPA: hypothetical protein N0F65_009371 [Lagenidium giganteum]|uniref:PPM-type phosphatase domain-containing protein n=1 Tax=Lagenidium giganteum TaxID=4803 RepID=A0AAV2ZFR3_9STRA|nr:TPA: hypothetical protein N0F65_009371 [Lagenidium giganteum]